MTKVVIYLRASSPEQHTNIQRQICEKHCIDKEYEIVKIISEKSSAYRNGNKRILFDFLRNIDSNAAFDKLIFYSYDRFSRNIVDGIEMVQFLNDRKISIESVLDNIDYNTPAGRKMLFERFVLAQYESDLISHRVKTANEFKRNFGLYIGPTPFGKTIDPIHKKDLLDNKNEQKIINFIKLAKDGGLTGDELTNMLNDIKELEEDDVIGTYNKDNELVEPAEPMSNKEISDILNDCKIRKRRRSWTPTSVRNVAKKNKINVI
jgi:site-specific DNA recombinase